MNNKKIKVDIKHFKGKGLLLGEVQGVEELRAMQIIINDYSIGNNFVSVNVL